MYSIYEIGFCFLCISNLVCTDYVIWPTGVVPSLKIIKGIMMFYLWWHLANMREHIKDQCQAVIEIITGGCIWYERGKDGKNVVCKLCKREPESVEHFLYSCTMFKNDVNDMFNYVCKDIMIDNFEYMTVEYNALVSVNSQGPPHGHTQGILTFEKMCCQSSLYGSKVPCHKCISALGCIDFYIKMLLDGCSIPNNAP